MSSEESSLASDNLDDNSHSHDEITSNGGSRKRKERRERNREAAKRSRLRRKILIDHLQETVANLTQENKVLSEQNNALKQHFTEMQQIRLATSFAGNSQGPVRTDLSFNQKKFTNRTADIILQRRDHFHGEPVRNIQNVAV